MSFDGNTDDSNSNQLTMTDAFGTTSRTYDELNRVLTKSVPYIGSSTFIYDIISGVDAGCVKETSLDPKGNLTERVYDRAGRLWTVTTDGKTTVYSYYDNGNRQSVVYQDGSREDYTYYADNLLCTLTNKKVDETVIDTYTYEYDASNNQTRKTDSRGSTAGQTCYYMYNGHGDVTSLLDSGTGVIAGTYYYDAFGNILDHTGTGSSISSLSQNIVQLARKLVLQLP